MRAVLRGVVSAPEFTGMQHKVEGFDSCAMGHSPDTLNNSVNQLTAKRSYRMS